MDVYTKQQWIAEQARNHPERVFTSLHHLMDRPWMHEAYRRTRKDGAVGIDGETAQQYAQDLEANLDDLLERIRSGRYFAPPVRRHYIPKADGAKRALGIPTFEDKVAQRAVLMILEPMYEQAFLDCSYGFRPGRSAHDAVQSLRDGIMENGHRWVVDADISKYFDTIEHRHLRSFLDLRIRDGVIRRMIDKWLKAGILEGRVLHRAKAGAPQGGVLSPLLANLYLHHVLDRWFVEVAKPRLKGRCQLVRFADDFVMSFEDYQSGLRMQDVVGKRLARYGLTLNAEKTRYVDFRFKRPQGQHPGTQATTFDFLGFTHVWGWSRRGKPVVRQFTAKDRYARSLRGLWLWCKRHRHLPLQEQHQRLCRQVQGHFAYFGVTGNGKRLKWYRHQAERIWQHWLARRSRQSGFTWRRMRSVLQRYPLPPVRIVHHWSRA